MKLLLMWHMEHIPLVNNGDLLYMKCIESGIDVE
jgi:hypothetical protein